MNEHGPDFVYHIDFVSLPQRCFSCWMHYYPSDGYIIQSKVESVSCPEVFTVWWSQLYVNVWACPCSVQYTAAHTDSMLINFVPINAVCSLLSVGSNVGTKPFWEFECQHLLPLISTLSCVCVPMIGSIAFILCSPRWAIMTNLGGKVLIIIIEMLHAFLGPLQAFSNVSAVFRFVLPCRDRVCSTGRWTWVIFWTFTACSHTLTDC